MGKYILAFWLMLQTLINLDYLINGTELKGIQEFTPAILLVTGIIGTYYILRAQID